MKYIFFLIIVATLQCCNEKASEKKMGHPVAVASGIENFKNVKMIEFIFNVQKDTFPASSRHWQWFPHKNEVIFLTDSSNIKFNRGDTSTQELQKLNARFTNDEYWLLYPFHLDWDSGMELVDNGIKTGPISGKAMHMLTTKYNSTAGFTPADMYSLYINDKQQIQEWEYHKAGSPEATLVTSWENYKDFNGIQVSQDHKTKDGKFHIWFTGIQILN